MTSQCRLGKTIVKLNKYLWILFCLPWKNSEKGTFFNLIFSTTKLSIYQTAEKLGEKN